MNLIKTSIHIRHQKLRHMSRECGMNSLKRIADGIKTTPCSSPEPPHVEQYASVVEKGDIIIYKVAPDAFTNLYDDIVY
jgi:hypothetical protein